MIDLHAGAPLAPRLPLSARTSLGWALAFSSFVHVAIAWRLTFGAHPFADRGEDGREGGGGATFEVSMQGPVEDTTHPAIGQPDPEPPAVPILAIRPSRSTATATPTPTSTSTSTSTATPTSTSTSTSTTTSTATSTAIAIAIAAAGTGDETTDPGRLQGRDDARIRALLAGSVGGALGGSALGDVALLTEASRCPDPVAGTWTSHRYSPEFRDWARFTLSITRSGDELTGTIRTRMWRGMPSDTRPPACSADGWDYTVEMRALGTVHGESFDFGAREHHVAHVECASPAFGYNPDHFSGTFDVERDQLRTLNNDGGRDVNAAYTFRRSSCQP